MLQKFHCGIQEVGKEHRQDKEQNDMKGSIGDAAHCRKEKNRQQNARRASLWKFHDLSNRSCPGCTFGPRFTLSLRHPYIAPSITQEAPSKLRRTQMPSAFCSRGLKLISKKG